MTLVHEQLQHTDKVFYLVQYTLVGGEVTYPELHYPLMSQHWWGCDVVSAELSQTDLVYQRPWITQASVLLSNRHDV